MNGADRNINGHLIDRCIRGEADAQYLLYKMYSKAMFNIAVRFLNNRMDAEDILQESFVTAFGKLSSLSDPDSFGAWLKRIVVNNCIDYLKRNKTGFEDIEHCPDPADTDQDDTTFNPDPAKVHQAIKELPPGSRTILSLYALEGYKHREIAVMLGISESTSKSQYRRAIELLGKALKQRLYDFQT